MSSEPIVTQILSSEGQPIAQKVRVYRLRVREPSKPPRVERVQQSVARIGTHPGNDVVLEDDAVSRIHCEIIAEEKGFRLRDLDSTNGTFVAGTRIFDGYLEPGAHIVVGLTEIEFDVLEDQIEVPLAATDRFGPVVGKSPAMRELFAKLQRVAPTDFTVLIQGESGTGKELIAEAIHSASKRAGGPFVVFDCAAIPANLIESELFGHEKGAFTGADTRRQGCLEEADGGTLFLDEVGELPLDLQPKLLRAVEKREVRALGSNRSKRVDVRIVAATNRDLAREVNRGGFRDDLYYRLAVVRLKPPPLRHRVEDIRPLVEHLVQQILRADPSRAAAVLRSISEENWRRLTKHPWRGNVRELRNVIERSLALSESAVPNDIEPASSASVMPADPMGSEPTDPAETQLKVNVDLERGLLEQKKELVASFERAYLTQMLERHQGNFSRAAESAGIDRMYFKRLLKKYQ